MYNAFGANSTLATPINPTNDRVAFDNLLRRELRVGDPTSAREIADALLERYKADPRAMAIQQEALGLPALRAPSSAPILQAAPTASDKEWRQAVDDAERDLRELTTNTLLKDVMPELNGWTQAIRSALSEVDAAACFALDARQRDKTLSLRRQLSDYARFARLIGALTPDANGIYRQLAESLDEAAAVALVRIGEALANEGFSGNYLIQTPYTELGTRRDAAVYALRGLTGATQQAFGQNQWPRGLNAYRRLYEVLEQQGQGELRSLLVETELARAMDDLIQRAGNGTAEGLRAAGATAEVDLLRFRRLIATGRSLGRPESPQLSGFLEALQLFADAFSPSGGSRLLRIARPAILQYGIYRASSEHAERRLLQLVALRNQLADQLDCFVNCGCDFSVVQTGLDLCMHAVDRAIDLYAAGREEFGSSECRASAVAYLLLAFQEFILPNTALQAQQLRGLVPSARVTANSFADERQRQLALARLHLAEVRLNGLVRTTTAIQPGLGAGQVALAEIDAVLDGLIVMLAPFGPTAQVTLDWGGSFAFDTSDFVAIREQELCLLFQAEQKWSSVVPTIAPGCSRDDLVVGEGGVLEYLASRAIALNAARFRPGVGIVPPPLTRIHICPPRTPDLPPHYETLLNGIVNDIGSSDVDL